MTQNDKCIACSVMHILDELCNSLRRMETDGFSKVERELTNVAIDNVHAAVRTLDKLTQLEK